MRPPRAVPALAAVLTCLAACERSSAPDEGAARASGQHVEVRAHEPAHSGHPEFTAVELSRALGFHWWELVVPDGGARRLRLRVEGPSIDLTRPVLEWSRGLEAGQPMKLALRRDQGNELEYVLVKGFGTTRNSMVNPFDGCVIVFTQGPIVGDGVLMRGRKGSVTTERQPDDVVLSVEWD